MGSRETIVEARFDRDRKQIMKVRYSVFVEEQGVPVELEQDEKDPGCLHALLLVNGMPTGTGRLESDGHIGRVAVLKGYRGNGAGRRVVAFLEARARERGLRRVYLGAQVQAIPFYEKQGYRCGGPEFMDAGIPHRHMYKAI